MNTKNSFCRLCRFSNSKKAFASFATALATIGAQAYTITVTNGMQSIVVPDSIQYVDIQVSSSYKSGLQTVHLGSSFRSFMEGPGDYGWYYGYNPEKHVGEHGSYIFCSFPEMQSFSVSSSNDALKSDAGVLYSNKYGYYENGEPILDSDGEKLGLSNRTTLLLCPRGRKSVAIKKGSVRVGNYAFRASDIASVWFPDTVQSIGEYAFDSCTNLTSIVLPDSAKLIQRGAFQFCRKLGRIELPDEVSIDTVVPPFYNCTNLSEIVFRGLPKNIAASTFKYARKDCVVYVPRYSTGWGVDIPGTWNGLQIEYITPQSCMHDGKTSIINRREATCAETGYSGDNVCYLCGEIIESGTSISALGHNMGAGVVTKEPTVSEAGVMSYYCTRCGVLMKTESIATLDLSRVLGDCLGGLPDGSVTLGSDEVKWSSDSEITHNGKGSLRLMGNGDGSESSMCFAVEGAGQLSYWWKSSSEYDSEENAVYDYAYLTLDGEAQGGLTDNGQLLGLAIGGEMDWTNIVVDITGDGAHTVAWTYKKDEVDDILGFEDCVWLENVVWRPVVTASFALGGGTGSEPESIAALSGTAITLPSPDGFSRDGHVFAGWSDGTYLYTAGDSYTLEDTDAAFTATWIRKSILTFALGGGIGALPSAIYGVPGRVVSLPDANGIERDGYVFAGWSDGANTYAAGEPYTLGNSDVVFTARWTRKSILTFALGGGTGDVPAAIKEVPGTVVVLPAASGFGKPKHGFAGWSDGAKTYEENASYTVTDSDVTFTAQWVAKTISKPIIQSPDVANGGVVTDAAFVTLTLSTDTGATLHYTLDGSTPTAESPVYTGSMELTDYAVKMKVIAIRDDYFDSEVAEFSFTRKPYTLAECLGMEGVSDAVVAVGGDGEAWHRVCGGESHDGTAGLRSGAITHNQTNWVEVCVNGPGTLSFWWKASSEMVRGKVRDGAAFFVDGELQAGPIGGTDGDWALVSHEVAGEGPHTFRWEFGKSATDSADIGEDCAWLDDVTWVVPCAVSDVVAKQRYPWNGLVDIACKVSGILGTADGYKFNVAAVIPDSDEVRNVSQVWVVRDGKRSTDLAVRTSGDYRLLWDARADLGEVRYSNMIVRVTINYIVKYNPGVNGSGFQQTSDKIHGIAMTLNGVTFTRYGYTQTGWAMRDGGAKAYGLGEPYMANAPIVLYPYWSLNAYTVTYRPGPNGIGLEQAESKWHDIDLSLNGALFSREGYTQTGWTTSDGGTKTYDLGASFTANIAITLYPYWTPNTYVVTYKPGANGSGAQQTSNKTHDVAMALKGATFTRDGYTQTGWSTSDGGAKVYDLGENYTVNSAATLYPYWTLNTYTVTYKPGANGSGTLQTATKTHGIALTLKDALFTRSGYTQTGWATSDGGAKVYDLGENYTVNSAATLYPYWTLNTYTVTYKPGTNGSGLQQSEEKMHGVALTLKGAMFMRGGYTQTGWATSDGGLKVYDLGETYTVNAAVTLYPYWEIQMIQLWANGPYWATINIGAAKPEDSGYYFWWGDTVGYKRVGNSWVATDGSSTSFPFISCPTNNKNIDTLKSKGWVTSDGVLAPEHDAAHVQWGGNWRMPTEDEIGALINNCSWTWTTLNGVYGYIVRGKGAYSPNSIFLPCAGLGYRTAFLYARSEGYYWSSVPGLLSGAGGLHFDSGSHGTGGYGRDDGHSVRPVQEGSN